MVESWPSVRPVGSVDARTQAAGDLGGFTNRVVGGMVVTKAMMSRDFFEVVNEALREPEEAEFERLLEAWPSYDWSRSFKAQYKLVDTESGSPAVVQRIPGLTGTALADMGPDTEEVLKSYVDAKRNEAPRQVGSNVVRKAKCKVYELGSFFHDVDVLEKYQVPDQLMALVRRTAVVDAAGACGVLRRWLRNRGVEVEIRPGGYAKGGKAAKTVLLAASESASLMAPLGSPVIVGSDIYFESSGEEGDDAWSVSGPLRHADVVRGVAAMVLLRGPTSIATLFSEQLVRLGIDLVGRGVSVGLPDRHSGSLSIDLEGAVTPFSLNADWVEPLADDTGRLMGSAIRVSSDTSVTNGHVFGEDGETMVLCIRGSPVSVVSRCSVDAVLVQHGVVSTSQPYSKSAHVREAVEGEQARLVGASNAMGNTRDFGQVTVRKVEPGALMTTLVPMAVHGCSGSSLVAVADGALLGLYHGSTRWDSVFVPALEFASMMATPPLSDGTLSRASEDGVVVFDRLMARGLGVQLDAISRSLEGLYVDGKCVGSGLMGRSGLLTTIDPSLWPVRRMDGVAYREVASGDSKFVLGGAHDTEKFVGRSRLPMFEERVAFMGKDADGDIYMTVASVVCGRVKDGGFYVADPKGLDEVVLQGAVVVALVDGAVLGVCAGFCSGHSGRVLRAVTLADSELRARSALVELLPKIRGLDIRLLSEKVCGAVLEASAPGARAFYSIGEMVVGQMEEKCTMRVRAGDVFVKLSKKIVRHKAMSVGLDAYGLLVRLVGAVCKTSGNDAACDIAASLVRRSEARPMSWSVGDDSVVVDFG